MKSFRSQVYGFGLTALALLALLFYFRGSHRSEVRRFSSMERSVASQSWAPGNRNQARGLEALDQESERESAPARVVRDEATDPEVCRQTCTGSIRKAGTHLGKMAIVLITFRAPAEAIERLQRLADKAEAVSKNREEGAFDIENMEACRDDAGDFVAEMEQALREFPDVPVRNQQLRALQASIELLEDFGRGSDCRMPEDAIRASDFAHEDMVDAVDRYLGKGSG